MNHPTSWRSYVNNYLLFFKIPTVEIRYTLGKKF